MATQNEGYFIPCVKFQECDLHPTWLLLSLYSLRGCVKLDLTCEGGPLQIGYPIRNKFAPKSANSESICKKIPIYIGI